MKNNDSEVTNDINTYESFIQRLQTAATEFGLPIDCVPMSIKTENKNIHLNKLILPY